MAHPPNFAHLIAVSIPLFLLFADDLFQVEVIGRFIKQNVFYRLSAIFFLLLV